MVAPPDDCGLNVLCHAKKQAGDAAGTVAGSALDKAAQDFAKSAVKVYQYLVTFWVDPEVGDSGKDFGRLFSPRISDNADDPTYFLASHTGWLVTWVAVLGLLLAAGRMAWQRRGEPFREAMSGMVTLVVVVFAVTQVVNLALIAGDEYSRWIIEASTQGDVQGNLGKTAGLLAATGQSSGLLLIVGLLALLAGVVQLALMFVRGAMLVLLAGALPLGAAASIAPEGRAWYRKLLGWLVAFVLYKPVAATVYAVAFKALTGDSIAQMQGIILSILAVLVLPALMRFIVPLVSAASGGGGGGGAALAAGSVAMGARMVPSLGGGKSGGGGPQGSTGASGAGGPKGSQTAGGQQPNRGGDKPGGEGPGSQPTGGGQPPAGQQPASGGQPTAEQPTPGAQPTSGAPASGGQPTPAGSGGAGQSTAAGANTTAGAKGGPWGAAAGAAADTAHGVKQGMKNVGHNATGDQEGPSGS